MAKTFKAGDEVIVTDCDHEANVGAWLNVEKKGIEVKFYVANLAPIPHDAPRTR